MRPVSLLLLQLLLLHRPHASPAAAATEQQWLASYDLDDHGGVLPPSVVAAGEPALLRGSLFREWLASGRWTPEGLAMSVHPRMSLLAERSRRRFFTKKGGLPDDPLLLPDDAFPCDTVRVAARPFFRRTLAADPRLVPAARRFYYYYATNVADLLPRRGDGFWRYAPRWRALTVNASEAPPPVLAPVLHALPGDGGRGGDGSVVAGAGSEEGSQAGSGAGSEAGTESISALAAALGVAAAPPSLKLWSAQEGAATQCHYDVAHNVLVQLHGTYTPVTAASAASKPPPAPPAFCLPPNTTQGEVHSRETALHPVRSPRCSVTRPAPPTTTDCRRPQTRDALLPGDGARSVPLPRDAPPRAQVTDRL